MAYECNTGSLCPSKKCVNRAGKSSFSGPDQIRPWASSSPLPPVLNVSVRSRGAGVWLRRRQHVSTFYQPCVCTMIDFTWWIQSQVRGGCKSGHAPKHPQAKKKHVYNIRKVSFNSTTNLECCGIRWADEFVYKWEEPFWIPSFLNIFTQVRFWVKHTLLGQIMWTTYTRRNYQYDHG